jgi:hypothetical protein
MTMDASGPTYIISQWLFLKLLGIVFGIAFCSLLIQVDGLYGSRGILPIRDLIGPLQKREIARVLAWLPSLFLFHCSDIFIRCCAAAGVAFSVLLLAGFLPALMLVLLWLLYLSFVSVGREFLSFQWDMLLLETGFMAIFFALLTPPPVLVIWGWWLFLFRFIVSAGVVKLTSGDPHWRNLTALRYHYETQPLPNRIAWYAHQLPQTVQKFSTFGTFFFELAVPFFIFGPDPVKYVAFWLLVFFQGLILLTGSYGFFNLLTIVMAVPLLNDNYLQRFAEFVRVPISSQPGTLLTAAVCAVIALLMLFNVLQLIQLFYRSRIFARIIIPLSRWGISSPYGLFAVMTTERFEFVIEGSHDARAWQPYAFRWKPGHPSAPPRQVAPHQPRLDWQMWFAALQPSLIEPWLGKFVLRLLQGSPPVVALLKNNPFQDAPPRYIRVVAYQYHFTDWQTRRTMGTWWRRDLIGASDPLSLPEEQVDRR